MSTIQTQVISSSLQAGRIPEQSSLENRFQMATAAVLVVLLALLLGLAGCGEGGYPGGGIVSLSASSITIDASQVVTVTSIEDQSVGVTWSIASCSGSACGTLSNPTGNSVQYIAPLTLASQIHLSLIASVAGTNSKKNVSITVNPAPVISTALPSAIVGVPYSTVVGVVGGTLPIKWASPLEALPAGLSFNPTTATIAGTPTIAGTVSFNLQLTDASDIPYTAVGAESIVVAASGSPLTVIGGNPPSGIVGVAYTTALTATGGTQPYTWSIASGGLPAGLSISSTTGIISGTPTTAQASVFTAQAQDAVGVKASAVFTITISASATQLRLTVTTLPNGTVGVPYSATIGVSGGTAPYSCIFTTGALPAGLTLSGCVVSGTPTTAGTSNLIVKATDSASPAQTVSGPIAITITGGTTALTLTVSTLPNGTVGVAYSATIGVSGGTAPYSCIFTSGTLPTGLSLSGCVVSGTPTTAGTSNLIVKATDSSNPTQTVSGPIAITITAAPAPLTLTLSTLPNGTVGIAYSATIGVAGGTAPYVCSIVSGTLQAGLTLNGCVVSGTPTVAGTVNLTVKATDSSTPTQTTTGPVSLTISPAGAPLTLTLSSLPDGTVGIVYNETIGVSGGTAPYSCAIISGTLPAGLSLSGCVVSGTPTTAGTSNLTVKATDSSNPTQSVTGPVSITINGAVVLTLSSPPPATVSVPYSGTIPVSGGSSPYGCLITAGALPAGLSLSGCVISGTPTVATTVTITVKATDSGNPVHSITGPVTVTVNATSVVLSLSNPPNGTVGSVYTGSVGVAGGTAPYTCTLVSGAVPPGLTLATSCSLTGTPTTAGSATFSVKATDSSSPASTTTASLNMTIAPAGTLTVTAPPPATVGAPYTGPIGITGGNPPYTCKLVSGTLPAGLSLNNCTVVGTPTTPGASPIVVTVTDTSNPPITTTAPITITVNPVAILTLTGAVPNAVLGVPYTQTLTAAGGLKPYSFTTTAGTLPPGLTLSSSGVISGTPTAIGASSFTATVTDTESTPQTASLPLIILVTYPVTTNDGKFKGPYAFLTQGYDDAVLGLLAYQNASVASFTADGAAAISLGEMDSNHQNSTAVGNVVASNTFLGTYQINADNRGFLTLTAITSTGTTGKTSTYALALKAVVSPATIYTQGSLIEADSNQLVGTKATGTLLAQNPAAVTAGPSGSYAFGLQGDTACPITCTVGILGGPAASVGQFTVTTSSSTIAGTGDANISSTTYASSTLAGSFGAVDANGRSQLTMLTSAAPSNYPSDYAVYIVDANNAFILSNDKHSAFILLAGSAQTRTQTAFSNASLNNSFIGYENSAANSGLVTGLVLQNVLNFSTATVFRSTSTADGNCNISSADTGGVDSLVSSVTGLLGSVLGLGLDTVLGTFDATGPATCAVSGTGRATLQFPQQYGLLNVPIGTPPAPRVLYLSAPDKGYFLETSYAGIGNIEPQTGQPYNAATFNGTYVYGAPAASSVASINSTGTITSNGNGTATSTTDANIGVGTINVLQLGVSGNSTYTTPDPVTGRFIINGTVVVYTIAPGRFAAVDTNKLTTAPPYTLLY